MKYAADSCHANGMKYSVYDPLHNRSFTHLFIPAALRSDLQEYCRNLRLSRSLNNFR